jgi:hypothetical protein
MKFVAPWRAVKDQAFDRELEREAVEGHVLYGIPVATIARRDDTDDVLFGLLGGTGRVADVRLTWAAETDLKSPLPRCLPICRPGRKR